ncbi:MAG: anti-sigma factor family protein [Thalassotalea sp.]
MSTTDISDETLSAFLDAELPELEMEQIRAAMMTDDALANRLAELAMVDEIVAGHYETINQQPLPDAIEQLLTELPDQQTLNNRYQAQQNTDNNNNKVVSLWQYCRDTTKNHMALAAGFAAALGFSSALMFSNNDLIPEDNWQAVAQVLEQQPSGQESILANGEKIATKLTFINKQGQVCRQFEVNQGQTNSQSIACRVNQAWQLTLTVHEPKQAQQGYQTATSNSLMRHQIDQMIDGDFFDQQQEQSAINSNWQNK